jgi:predicted ATPase
MITTAEQASLEERQLLDEALRTFLETGSWPAARDFRVAHERQRHLVDALQARGWLDYRDGSYIVTGRGLHWCSRELAERLSSECDQVLRTLQELYRSGPSRRVSVEQVAQRMGRPLHEAVVGLGYQVVVGNFWSTASGTGSSLTLDLTEAVLDAQPLQPLLMALFDEREASKAPLRLSSLRVQGYRPFADLQAELGPLTVLIGANATGKTSLIDLLRLLSFAATAPLPPSIDPRGPGKTLFYTGGSERIACTLGLTREEHKPLHYELELHGPVGSPRLVHERLYTEGGGEDAQVLLLDFANGRGVLRSPPDWLFHPQSWSLQPGEFSIRRAIDPALLAPYRLQQFLSSWRFYGSIDVSWNAQVRKPVPPEQEAVLNEDGSNLSAVLFNLLTGNQEAWEDLELSLRSAVPGLQSINVRPQGQGLMGTFQEWQGGRLRDLTLADLSDGSLRFLCWAVLCLSPKKPPLICIDEPEMGLHPRALPILASLLRHASQDSQFLVTTHSPYFLSQFSLEEVAVMRKEDGAAIMVRPASNEGLRREIEELGSEELARMHISDELEARS